MHSIIFHKEKNLFQMPLPNLSSSEKEQFKTNIRQKIAIANIQEFITKITTKCFQMCVTKPGSKLGISEQKCITMCMDRYMDSWKIVSRACLERIQQEQTGVTF